MSKNTCARCKHMMKAPKYPQYRRYYGWCCCPLPFWAGDSQPLVKRGALRKQECPAYQPKQPRKNDPEEGYADPRWDYTDSSEEEVYENAYVEGPDPSWWGDEGDY